MTSLNDQKVAIIGAGTMGHGIAQSFAVKGRQANVFDIDGQALAKVPGRVEANLAAFKELGLIDQAGVDSCLANIHLFDDLAGAVQGCGMVIETVAEVLDIKRRVFAQLEETAEPSAILATNTSALAIGLIAEDLSRPERVVGTHFWNPPHVLPCVEVIRSSFTSEEVFEMAVAAMAAIGKEPIRVLKDVPGFLGNRMQHALQREAISLVDSGVASAEDVDRVVKYSFGLRMPLMGPLERADLGGLDTTSRVQAYLLPDLDDRIEVSESLKAKVDQGDLGAKTGRGYYDWPQEKLDKIIKERDLRLLQVLAAAGEK